MSFEQASTYPDLCFGKIMLVAVGERGLKANYKATVMIRKRKNEKKK